MHSGLWWSRISLCRLSYGTVTVVGLGYIGGRWGRSVVRLGLLRPLPVSAGDHDLPCSLFSSFLLSSPFSGTVLDGWGDFYVRVDVCVCVYVVQVQLVHTYIFRLMLLSFSSRKSKSVVQIRDGAGHAREAWSDEKEAEMKKKVSWPNSRREMKKTERERENSGKEGWGVGEWC